MNLKRRKELDRVEIARGAGATLHWGRRCDAAPAEEMGARPAPRGQLGQLGSSHPPAAPGLTLNYN